MVQGLAERVEELERRIVEIKVVELVRPGGAAGAGGARAEQAAAREIIKADSTALGEVAPERDRRPRADLPGDVSQAPQVSLAALKPNQVAVVSRMAVFSRKVGEMSD